ncbi:mandelate racemase/muconate lactonizing enzyme family protein [Alkalibaculum sp. M08DMB]|uniref:Mandelate racemase/muconate lactonizing enzyme family protein n=1 Tax=Alkalibaculum sporogenes TaxID=2655001 RepID=A0A6A7KA19_9FIRM|nr:mandelate racemase/muconate lactonizing enzyme family protein [Alkalibaculum sporogenes]MPW26348.1 mandelate racemase/muconate lactonizing enzyme family protein [Alkalibaculum sporogenes]
MKIRKIEVFHMNTANNKMNSPIGCRIYTDTGLYGDGEAGMAYGTGGSAAYGMVCDLAELIIGMNPLENEVIWEKMYKSTFWGQNGGPVVFSGIAAIDVALWDIKGKHFGVPCYTLLGGKMRENLRCYASQLQFGWGKIDEPQVWATSLEDYASNALLAMAEGYDAIKVDFFDRDEAGKSLNSLEQTGLLSPKKLNMVEARIKAVRDAIGPDVDIIMENHSYPDAISAVQLGKLAEKYNIWAFEEPNTPSVKTSEYIAKNLSIPIANGERIFSRWQYAPYFEKNLIQLAQPDIGNCGGITEVKKICDLAYIYDVAIQIHVAGSPLATNVALHLEAAIPNFTIHEHHVANRMDTSKGLTKFNLQPENGYFTVPELPGIGNEFLQSAIDNSYERKVIE